MPIVRESFKTGGVVYAQGTEVPAKDPICKSHRVYFDDGPPVEQATAAPGEKRATKRPTKKAAAAKPPAKG